MVCRLIRRTLPWVLCLAAVGARATSHPNRAAVTWVSFADEPMFKSAEHRIEELVVGQTEKSRFFGISEESRFKVTGSFEQSVSAALSRIEGQPNPQLFIFLDSHGDVGKMLQKSGADVPHHQLVDQLFRQVESRKGLGQRITINIVYDACHSDSLKSALRDRWFEAQLSSGGRLKYRVNLLSSAAPNAKATGNRALETLRGIDEYLSGIDHALEAGIVKGGIHVSEGRDFSTLAKHFKIMNTAYRDRPNPSTFRAWSSYRDLDHWTPSELIRYYEMAESSPPLRDAYFEVLKGMYERGAFDLSELDALYPPSEAGALEALRLKLKPGCFRGLMTEVVGR